MYPSILNFGYDPDARRLAQRMADLFANAKVDAHAWTSPQDAANYLASKSHMGATPITKLVMIGLDYAGDAAATAVAKRMPRNDQQWNALLNQAKKTAARLLNDSGSTPGQLVAAPGTGFFADDLYTNGPQNAFMLDPEQKSNYIQYAAQREGPPKVWFAKDAQIYGLGCGTSYFWAPDWASVLRQDANVYGTTRVLGYSGGAFLL